MTYPMQAGVRSERESFYVGTPFLREAWGAWVDSCGPWDWFATFTFKRDIGPDPAIERFDKWRGRLSEALRQHVGRTTGRKAVRCVLAVEWTTFGRVHLHAVLRAQGLSGVRRQRWRHRWEALDSACGIARIERASGGRASTYLAKYISKGGVIVTRGCFGDRSSPGHSVSAVSWNEGKTVRSTALPSAQRPRQVASATRI